MANGTVGVLQSPTADRLIDNESLTVGGQMVQRQRVDVVPSAESAYKSGTSGSVNVPTTHQMVVISAYFASAGTIVINGGDSIAVGAGVAFSDDLADAPITGTGAGSVVFTGSSSYYVRYRPKVA